MTKTLVLWIWVAMVSCTTHRAPPSALPLTMPAPPADLRDTILQLAIRAAIAPDSSTNTRRVLLQPPQSTDPPRILPSLPQVTFVTLDSGGFQNLADRLGLITVWIVGAPHIYSDSAEVDIWRKPVQPRREAIPGWGGGCTYLLKRSINGWRVVRAVRCIYEG